MPKLPVHNWSINENRTEARCLSCDYRVVSDPADEETRGGSKHMPDEKTIYTTDRVLNETISEHLCAVWGVKCHA